MARGSQALAGALQPWRDTGGLSPDGGGGGELGLKALSFQLATSMDLAW